MTQRSPVSVVVLSWNTLELTRTCLRFVCASQPMPAQVIVIDNASEDGSADMIAAEFPAVELQRNPRNEGFAIGCNQGLALAKQPYILLLNSDTEVGADAIERMRAFLEAAPKHAAVAAHLIHPDGGTQRTCNRFPGLLTPLLWGTPFERWFPNSFELKRYFMRDWDHKSSRDVDQPPAAVLMLKRSALDVVGVFDERLWLFFNDVDLSKRLAQAGYKTHYLAEARVVHHVGASTKKFAGFVPEYQKNRLVYYRKHFGRLAGIWLKACVVLSYWDFVWAQRRAARRGEPVQAVPPVRAALKDFLRL
jgi:N-acetylglucosaminyl-diphospho-decaprenol L-rhamnosyltransferase